MTVTPSVDGKRVTAALHGLVLEAFQGPRPEGLVARHLDDNPLNNTVENLVWGTQSENVLDAVRNGTHRQTQKTHCPRRHPLVVGNLAAYELARGQRKCLTCKREKARSG